MDVKGADDLAKALERTESALRGATSDLERTRGTLSELLATPPGLTLADLRERFGVPEEAVVAFAQSAGELLEQRPLSVQAARRGGLLAAAGQAWDNELGPLLSSAQVRDVLGGAAQPGDLVLGLLVQPRDGVPYLLGVLLGGRHHLRGPPVGLLDQPHGLGLRLLHALARRGQQLLALLAGPLALLVGLLPCAAEELLGLAAPAVGLLLGGGQRLGRLRAEPLGGGGEPALIDNAFAALKPGGRIVANAVTLDTEQAVFAAQHKFGGTLTRLSVERLDAVGGKQAFRPAMAVTQWSATKP